MSNVEIASKVALLEPSLSEVPYAIPPHRRMLYIYRTSAERTSALLRAAVTSIEQGEAVVPFADHRFLSLLGQIAQATGSAAAHHLCPVDSLDPSQGAGPERLISLVRRALEAAENAGFPRTRVIVDTQLAYTLAGTEEDFVSFARSLALLARELNISVVQICFYEFLPRHALAEFLAMHSDVILSPALASSASPDAEAGSPLGLVSAIRALYLSKPRILRRVLDPVITGSDSADLLPLPSVTDYLREDFVLLDSDLTVRFISQEVPKENGALEDVLSSTDLPRVLSVIESMKAKRSADLFQLTLAGDSPTSGSPLLRIHKLAVEGELVGFLCVFHFVNPNSTNLPVRKSGTESLVTEREHEIASLLLSGMRNREIAELLNVAEITVKKHLGSIYRKLGVRNRVELIRLWDHSQS